MPPFRYFKTYFIFLFFKLLENGTTNDDSDDEADEYFSDMDGTSSINNPPSGLMSLLGKTH